MERLLNGYIKIDPIKYDSFVMTDKESYEAVGTVLGVPEGIDIPVGAKVWFDSWLCKKYPVVGQEGKYEWYVNVGEIVKYEV